MRVLTAFAIILVQSSIANASDFQLSDKIVILVSGPSAASTPWGFSGKSTMYLATSTQATGNFGFTVVEGAKDVACERRSAKKVSQPFDYTTSGQIPPGIYFVSYHRLDPNGNRHRLAIGDMQSGTTIKVNTTTEYVTRTDIQFHEAANNLERYTPRLSEGCIIFSDANFRKLFPPAFLDPATSPLSPSKARLPSATDFKGNGHVLVFVTDSTDTTRSDKQLQVFESVLAGADIAVSEESFSDNSKSLATIRLHWMGE